MACRNGGGIRGRDWMGWREGGVIEEDGGGGRIAETDNWEEGRVLNFYFLFFFVFEERGAARRGWGRWMWMRKW